MKGWMIRWILCIVALLLTAKLIPNFNPTIWAAILGSVFLGIINALIRPLLHLLRRYSPLNLAILTLIINGVMMWVTVMSIRGFDIQGLLWGFLVVLLFSLLSFVISFFIKDNLKYGGKRRLDYR